MTGTGAVRIIKIARGVSLFLTALNLVLGTLVTIAGHHLAWWSFAAALFTAGCAAYQTRAIRRIKASAAIRPGPDYAAISAMEREIFGRSFPHDH